jgi:predicted ribosome quality control (RQC) complex YloA/Tae2 family protein
MIRRLTAQGLSNPLDRILLSLYGGVGPQTVQEILYRAGMNPIQLLEYCGQYEYQRLWQAIGPLAQDLKHHRYAPEILTDPRRFSAIALTQYPESDRQAYDSMNQALDCFYQNQGIANLMRQRRNDLDQVLRRERERCEKKAGLQLEAVREAQNIQHLRLRGELLTANLHQISQGTEARVRNFYDPGQPWIVIPMDPRKTPSENAQAFFKQYHKIRQGAVIAQTHYEETLQELAYLESVQTALAQAERLEDIGEIRDELQESGYLKKDAAQKKRPLKQDRVELGKCVCLGFDIYYGKNNKQNDYLTMKLARGEDIWLHVKDIPGSHVLIKNPQSGPVPDAVLEKAAQLAAWHSKARQSAKTPVDYTRRKHVWKPTGARPGMVLYKEQRTLLVSPAQD